MFRCLLAFCFALAFTAADPSFIWTQNATVGQQVCAGDSVALNWTYSIANTSYILIEWYFHPADHPQERKLIAAVSGDTFLPSEDEPLAPRSMSQTTNAGIEIKNISQNNSGEYSATVGYRPGDGNMQFINSSVVTVTVHEKPSLRSGDQLKVDYNVTSRDGRNESSVILRCGQFKGRGNPPASVTWTTPEGSILNSTGYEDGFFILSREASAPPGEYVCAVNKSSTANCTHGGNIRNGTIKVDKDHNELSMLRGRFEQFQLDANREIKELRERLACLEGLHEECPARPMSPLVG